jgi:hypothetical protein
LVAEVGKCKVAPAVRSPDLDDDYNPPILLIEKNRVNGKKLALLPNIFRLTLRLKRPGPKEISHAPRPEMPLLENLW